MSDKKVLDLILNELKEIKTDVSELKTDVSELKTDVSDLKITVNRIDNNTADIREEMDAWFENVNQSLNQAFEKISENMEQKEKVDTIFNFLNKTKKPKINQYKRTKLVA